METYPSDSKWKRADFKFSISALIIESRAFPIRTGQENRMNADKVNTSFTTQHFLLKIKKNHTKHFNAY